MYILVQLFHAHIHQQYADKSAPRRHYRALVRALFRHEASARVTKCHYSHVAMGRGKRTKHRLDMAMAHVRDWSTEQIIFEIILDGLGQSQSQGRSASGIAGTPARYRDMLMDNETAMLKMPSFTETQQLTSLILPLTVLSLFLLMTMTMFLIFHMTFQGILYISSLSLSSVSSDSDSNNGNGNGNWSLSNSPLTMAIIMLLLLLENVLPWIFFGTGLYFAFSM